MKKLLLFSLLGVGAILPLQGAACVAGTALDYVNLGSTGCTINGSWTFSNFSFASTQSGGVAPTNLQEVINPLSGNGVGFSFTPTIAWFATTGIADVELVYKVTFTGNITSIFQSITGSIVAPTSAAFDNITDLYCPAGTLPPGSCAGVQNLQTNLTGSATIATGSATFAATHTLSVLKDVSANAQGFPGGTATVTSFTNCFNGTCSAVPEPGSYITAAFGLGLLAFSKIKFRRSA